MRSDIRNAIKIAIKEANKSRYRYRLGAVALKDGVIISRGYNLVGKNEHLHKIYNSYSVHAEAITAIRARGNADTLVVVRILKNGELTCSYPCKKCQQIIKNNGISKVMYFDWNGQIQQMDIR